MARISEELRVSKPAEEVFAYLADFRNERDWNSAARDVRLLTPGPISAGSRFEHLEQAPPPFGVCLITTEVVEWRPGEMIRFHHASVTPPWEATWRYQLRADGVGTKIMIDIDMRGAGGLRPLIPLMVPFIRRFRFRPSFTRLAEALERLESPRS